jgi:hypothetical protein
LRRETKHVAPKLVTHIQSFVHNPDLLMRSGLRPSFCENTAMAKATVTELLRIGKSRRLFRECFCRAHAKSRERRRAGKMCQIVSKKDYANPKPVSFHRPIKLFFAACKTCSTIFCGSLDNGFRRLGATNSPVASRFCHFGSSIRRCCRDRFCDNE